MLFLQNTNNRYCQTVCHCCDKYPWFRPSSDAVRSPNAVSWPFDFETLHSSPTSSTSVPVSSAPATQGKTSRQPRPPQSLGLPNRYRPLAPKPPSNPSPPTAPPPHNGANLNLNSASYTSGHAFNSPYQNPYQSNRPLYCSRNPNPKPASNSPFHTFYSRGLYISAYRTSPGPYNLTPRPPTDVTYPEDLPTSRRRREERRHRCSRSMELCLRRSGLICLMRRISWCLRRGS